MTKPIRNYSFFTLCPDTIRHHNTVKIDYTVHKGNPRLSDRYLEVHALWELTKALRESTARNADADPSKWRTKLVSHAKLNSDEYSVTVKISKK
jgi:hypothetical protein